MTTKTTVTILLLLLLSIFLVASANEEILENCEEIISVSKGGSVNELLALNYTTFPYKINPWFDCNEDNICLIGITFNNFSCVEYNSTSSSWEPIECSPDIFPLCAGRISYTADCETIDCCVLLNNMVYPNITEPRGGSYYYSLQFHSGNGGEINCDSFSSYTKDYCIQYLYYGASSDYGTCSDWQKLRERTTADDFSFSLF